MCVYLRVRVRARANNHMYIQEDGLLRRRSMLQAVGGDQGGHQCIYFFLWAEGYSLTSLIDDKNLLSLNEDNFRSRQGSSPSACCCFPF